jgi:hypothetical protein
MKNVILLLIIGITTILTCSSQNIEVKKSIWGYNFTQNGEKLTMSETVKKMEFNKNAFILMEKAKSNNLLEEIIGNSGAACIGYSIGIAISAGKPNWTLAGVGAGLIAISIPISLKVDKDVKKAIDLYNTNLNSATYKTKPEFEIMANGKGIGLTINF